MDARPTRVPSLLTLCLDALTRSPPSSPIKGSSSSAGIFWGGDAPTDAVAISPLPLPGEVKRKAIRSLRVGGTLSDEALIRLADYGFSSLCLAGCRQISGESLQHLPALCPLLTALDLSWCIQLRDADLDELTIPTLHALSLLGCFRVSSECVGRLLSRNAKLHTLRLDAQLPLEAPRLLSTEALTLGGGGGGSGTASLTILELSSASSAGANALCSLARAPWRHCLKVLVLRDAPALEDQHARMLLAACTALEHLDLRGCNAPRLRGAFLLSGPGSNSLRDLRLDGPGIGELSQPIPCSQHPDGGNATPQPQQPHAPLSESGSPRTNSSFVGGLTAPALAGLAALNGSPTLAALGRALNLSATSRAPSFEKLERLDVGGGGKALRQPFIRAMLAAAPALRVLELSPRLYRSTFLSDGSAAIWIGSSLPQLTILRLSRVVLGIDLAEAMLEHCPNLSHLRLHRCKQCTAAFAMAVCSSRNLRTLELSECGMSDEEIALMHSVLPETVEVVLEPPHSPQWLPEAVREDAAALCLWEPPRLGST